VSDRLQISGLIIATIMMAICGHQTNRPRRTTLSAPKLLLRTAVGDSREATGVVPIPAVTPATEANRTAKIGAAPPNALPPRDIGSSSVQNGSPRVARLPAVDLPPPSKVAPNLSEQPVRMHAPPPSDAAEFLPVAADGRADGGQADEATDRGSLPLENGTREGPASWSAKSHSEDTLRRSTALCSGTADELGEELPPPKLPIKDNREQESIHLATGEVKSFRLQGWEVSEVDVTQISIDEERICEGIVSERNKILLIGTATGITRLTVSANVNELGTRLSVVREFEIQVSSPEDSIVEDLPTKLAIVNRSIEKAYPNCSVSIRLRIDRLVVQGWCDSEGSAEGIVNLIRGVFLVRVEDELKVHPNVELSANPIVPCHPITISDPGCIDCGPQINGS
jgi:hypothetical protein